MQHLSQAKETRHAKNLGKFYCPFTLDLKCALFKLEITEQHQFAPHSFLSERVYVKYEILITCVMLIFSNCKFHFESMSSQIKGRCFLNCTRTRSGNHLTCRFKLQCHIKYNFPPSQ